MNVHNHSQFLFSAMVCPDGCSDEEAPVCGTDGVIYHNECLLRHVSCQTNKHIEISTLLGQCVLNPHNDNMDNGDGTKKGKDSNENTFDTDDDDDDDDDGNDDNETLSDKGTKLLLQNSRLQVVKMRIKMCLVL